MALSISKRQQLARRPALPILIACAVLVAAQSGPVYAVEKPGAEDTDTAAEPRGKGGRKGVKHKIPEVDEATRKRLATFALRQVDFGSISLLPVRFEKSRLAGPFEDDGRILYCVSSRMKGRSLTGYERAKVIIRDDAGTMKQVDEDDEVCEGHRTQPFPELEEIARGK